jgi:hypothetical protein
VRPFKQITRPWATGALAVAAALALCSPALAAPPPPSGVALQIDTVGTDIAYVFSWDNADPTLPAVELSVDGAPFAAAPYASAGLPGVPGGVVLQDSLTHLSSPGAHTLQVRFVGADGSASAPASYRWTNDPGAHRALKLRVKRVHRGAYRLQASLKDGQAYRWEMAGGTVCRKAACQVEVKPGRWYKLNLTVVDGSQAFVKTQLFQAR